MMRVAFIAALYLATGLAAAAAAQTPDPAEAMAKLRAADANHDGKWDKPEWLAAGRREMGFNVLDADKDGFVTTDELKTGMEKLKARRAN